GLHVGFDLPAGDPILDAFVEEGVVDAHDAAARDLRFAAKFVDHHAAILHGDHLRAADDAGLGVHHHLGDLNAADALIGEARLIQFRIPFPLPFDDVHAELGAVLLPLPGLTGLVHDLTRLNGHVLGLAAQAS